jgi:two-component system alkaline phosphatase synthesis response regulator PhoP
LQNLENDFLKDVCMKSVLVVDDEQDILELLRYNLEKDGFVVLTAADGKTALELAKRKPNLIILDIMLPELDGLQVIRSLKSSPETRTIPVLFLTAKGTELDEIVGLELGAEDYLVKPFSINSLLARVRAVLRRQEPSHGLQKSDETIEIDDLTINLANYTITTGGREVPLRKKEFETLVYLVTHNNRVITREELLNAVWGENVHVVDRTVDVHIRKIREKLGSYAKLLETVKGVGYRFRRS